YGIVPPSTTLRPAGSARYTPTRSAYGAGAAPCSSMSQFAVFIVCQKPLRSGWPSAVRAGLYAARVCEFTDLKPPHSNASARSAPIAAAARGALSLGPGFNFPTKRQLILRTVLPHRPARRCRTSRQIASDRLDI